MPLFVRLEYRLEPEFSSFRFPTKRGTPNSDLETNGPARIQRRQDRLL
jgi:hypothetical protein